MTDPCASIVTDPARMAGIWSDRSFLDQGVPYPPEMAAAPTSTPLNTSRRSRRSWFERRPATNFEIKVESPEKQEREKPVRKKRRESEEPEVLTLTHFTAPPRIGYGKMKPGEIKDRTLLFRNPHEYEQTVKIEKVPEKKGFSVDWRIMTVPAGDTCPLTITWEPKEEGNFREMIQMQVDKSYRLQAYVFGSVVAPPKKKKMRRGGLLSKKVNGPFSVIHTASLANIDKSYSPEMKTKDRPQVIKKMLKGKEKSSGQLKRHSPRLSGNTIITVYGEKDATKVVERNSKEQSEQENRGCSENVGLKKPLHLKDEKVPKKKMRHSNTYSNVSGFGLTIPVIHGESVQGHKSSENNSTVVKEQVRQCNLSGFEVIEAQTADFRSDKQQTVNSLPSFLEPDYKSDTERNDEKIVKEDDYSFVEVDSLEMKNEICHKSADHAIGKVDLEHSFVEIKSETFIPDNNLKNTLTVKKKLQLDHTINQGDIAPDSFECSRLRNNKLWKNPVLHHINKENSFMDSLDDTPNVVEPPSFLSPDSFVEDALKYKLQQSARKGKQSVEKESPANAAHQNTHLGSLVVNTDSFVSEVLSIRKQKVQDGLLEQKAPEESPTSMLNESIPHNVIIQQLESVKANLHEQSFEKGVTAKTSQQVKVTDRSETVILDRRETFIKRRSSPRFSVPVSEIELKRGTFVVGARKAKLLEKKQPSEASPRRTTFTVIKKTNVSGLKSRPRARSDDTLRTHHQRTRSLTKKSLKEDINLEIQPKECDKSNKDDSTWNNEKEKRVSVEKTIEGFPKAMNKGKSQYGKSDQTTIHGHFSEDSLDSKEASNTEFRTVSEIPFDHTDDASRRCTLTVTKTRPSDALLGSVRQTCAASACLFTKNNDHDVYKEEKQVDSFKETEEDCLESSQTSGRNSTYEVSANKSILLNKSGIQNESFPTTPNQLPNSPNPDHSRRSTHVVEKPKVLDLSRADRKTLFPSIVDYEDDFSEDNVDSLKTTTDKMSVISQGEQMIVSNILTIPDTRIRFSKRNSLKTKGNDPDELNNRENMTEESKIASFITSSEVCGKVKEDEIKMPGRSESEENITEQKEIKDIGQLLFIPVDKKSDKQEVKQMQTGPHQFLRKRSNVVVQKEDRIQSKRIKSDSDNLVTKKAARDEKQIHVVAGARTTRTRLKTIGAANERKEQQIIRSKAPVKGIAQSKLILMKKTKTALPKHPLPFAAKNMYYDERWMEKQERGFVNWLNFILTPAEEYLSNDVRVKVDAGKLAIDVAKGNIKLAPTNEVLSFRAYSAHKKLNRLRKSACRLFQSEDVIKVVQKLEAEVESKRLKVRKDKMMHADLGVKQKILDMLLSYNPLWLRIGLETIYGEVLPVQSNSDVFGLSRFILTRLLNSPEIAEEYAHPTVPHLYRDGYAEVVAQHTLKKFMMLVYFLDKAKLGRLIEHNPCLFCKDSEIKASKDFLLQFSRDYLSGEGDITRHLGYLGYKVLYMQTALDEFDFAVSKLAVDLRDGLRLTRVMEFLSNKPELSRTLRVPAISRLQKIHNVEVVFKTLEEQGIETDKVSPRDIVDGHREKTLKLLWTIILHYQVELLLNEDQLKEEIAILEKSLKVKSQLQKLMNCDKKPARESGEPDLHTQNPRLNLLLKWCRIVCAFYNIKIENFTVSFSDGRALCYIVHHYHPGLLPAEAIQSETTVTHLEDMEQKTQQQLTSSFNDSCNSSAAFGDVEDPEVFEGLLTNEKENFKVLFEKVKELGGIPLMLKWSDMSNTIPDEKVVVTYLLYLCARLLDIRHESRAARVIQLAWRKRQLRKMEKELEVKNKAAKVIQAMIRKYLARKRLARQEMSAVCIQRVWRGHQGRRLAWKLKAEKVLEKEKQAVLTLQGSIKQYLQRRRYLQMKQSIILLQAHCRGYLLRQKLSSAAPTIQKWVRRHQVRKQFELTKSVILIQARVRGHQQRLKYIRLKQATLVIQRKWHAKLVARQHVASLQVTRSAIILLQSKVRMVQQRRNYLNTLHSIITVQSAVRGYLVRKDIERNKRAATKIQTHVRGFLKRKKYVNLKTAAITCQRRYRAKLEGQKCRQQYMVSLGAAMTIQSFYRGHCVRKQLETQRNPAMKIQSHIRKHLQRKRFLRLKTAVKTCQSYYRAKLVGREQKCRFLKIKSAAVKIQSAYRQYKCRRQYFTDRSKLINLQACMKMYLARNRFLKTKAAAIVIQRKWRDTLITRQQRSVYNRLKKAVTLLQATWRMKLQRRKFTKIRESAVKIQSVCRMKQERNNFRQLKTAARTVQKHFRAKLATDKCRLDFLITKGAAVTIQAHIRGHLVRQKLKHENKAATVIQSLYKGHRDRSKYLKLKQVTVFCQRQFRAKYVGQKVQHEYEILKKGVIALQAIVRGHAERVRYVKLRESAIVLQSHFRGNRTRSNFKKLRQAALLVQRQFRANRIAKQYRNEYLSMQSAAIKIQSLARMVKQRKNYLQTVESVRKLQSVVRMVCSRKAYLKKLESAIKIQQWFRGVQETRRLENKLLVSRGAAITLQAAVRGFLARRQYQRNLAARKIQCFYRGYRERMKYWSVRRSIIVAQSVVRRHLARKLLKELKLRHRAAILIQQKWHATRKAREDHQCYKKLKHAVCVCQSAYRAKLAMLEDRKNFHLCKQAAIIMQAGMRGYIVRKMLKTQNAAAVAIQSAFRSYINRKKFLQLKQATLVCQVRLRAKSSGQKQRTNFLNLKQNVIKLQAIRRGTICKRDYIQKRNATVKIQSYVRGFLTRKALTRTRQAAVVIQRHWRANVLCRQKVLEYQKLKKASVCIQSVFRGRRTRLLFTRIKAAVKVQSWLRMVWTQKKFRKTIMAAQRIQAFLKMLIARKRFVFRREQRRKEREVYLSRVVLVTRVNLAAFRIQRCIRNYMVTKVAKEKLQSVILVQRWIRARLVRLQYLRTKQRICHLQSAVRTWLSRRHAAARVIQRVVRKWFANRHVRQETKAAVKIQALWRGYSLRSKTKSKRLTLVRQRVEEANAAATEDKKLGNRTSSALDYLLKYKHMSSVLDALKHLDVATRLSPVCCERMVEVNALGVLYQLMNSCNRSLPHIEIIKYTVNILLNLAKYEKTRHAVHSEEGGIQTIVELMQVYREKKGDIFPKACTLLGILALDNTCKMGLLQDKKLVERLRSIQSLTARKNKLEENQRITRARMNATFNSTFIVRSPVKKHKIKPDWSLYRDKLTDFDNPLKAINFVLGNLRISTK